MKFLRNSVSFSESSISSQPSKTTQSFFGLQEPISSIKSSSDISEKREPKLFAQSLYISFSKSSDESSFSASPEMLLQLMSTGRASLLKKRAFSSEYFLKKSKSPCKIARTSRLQKVVFPAPGFAWIKSRRPAAGKSLFCAILPPWRFSSASRAAILSSISLISSAALSFKFSL